MLNKKNVLDEIFLLSVEEYEQYKEHIPCIDCRWWLRSRGHHSDLAMNVEPFRYKKYLFYRPDGFGCIVCANELAVRPALQLNTSDLKIGQRIVKYDFPWIVIGDGIAIAEMPIAFHKYDEEDNEYYTSEIRLFLLEWVKNRFC